MIHDKLENYKQYIALHPKFQLAFEHLLSKDWSKEDEGKYYIDDDVKIIFSCTKGKKVDEAELETHKDFIDIQMPINITEGMGWKSTSDLGVESIPYDKQKDIAFYKDKPTDIVNVRPLEFVVFFPQDAHLPCIAEGNICKVIVKVKNLRSI